MDLRRIVSRYLQAVSVPFNSVQVLQLKRDLETWVQNVDRITTEEDYRRVEKAISVWSDLKRKEYQAVGKFLYDISGQAPNPERQMNIWRKKITPIFDASTSIHLPPWEIWNAEKYRRQQWAQKLQAIADKLPDVAKFLDNLRKQKKIVPTITTIEEQRINLEGLPVVTIGFDPDDPQHQEAFDVVRDGLRAYRSKAKVLPILLTHPAPIFLRFDVTASLGGAMGSGGNNNITLYPFNVAYKGARQVPQVIAHEMGHFVWSNVLSSQDEDFWRIAITRDLKDLDLRDLLKQWPSEKSLYRWLTDIRLSDPVLSLQLEALQTPSNPNIRQLNKYWERLDDREGIEAYLADGGTPTIKVPKTPISGYATTNAQEAFCEALGNLVAFGPATIHPQVLSWLKTILPGLRTA